MFNVQVLGDVGVVVDGTRYEIAAPRQRALLAILALEANRAVSSATLIEDIWGENLPAHPEAALQVLVSRLRTALGSAATRLVSGHAAYRLNVTNEEVDVAAAMDHLVRAQVWLQKNEPAYAIREVDLPLSGWSVDPLGYLEPFPCYERASRRVRELWVALSSLRVDALLAAGRHVEVLAMLDAWIADSPWDERRRAQQMLALYLSGRQVDALRAYDEFRELLIEQLGIDPTAQLRDLHHSILHQEASLVPGGVGVVSVLPPWTSERLPFMGRSREEERILGCLRSVAEGNARMILVEGEPGIGKTRLVLEIARRVQDDAVVLTATGNDARQSAVIAIVHELVDALVQLDDSELRLCVGRWPADLASIAPKLRDRLPDLGPPIEADPLLQAEQLRRSLVSCVSALSRRSPILLLLDDLHRAGPELLLLLGHLLVADSKPRVGVLATARTTAPDKSTRLAHLVSTLEQSNLVERVTLGGLDLTSVTRLLAERQVTDLAGRAASVFELTGGQPFFLCEMLDSEEARTGSFEHLPTSVLDFVRYRAHALGAAEEELLADVSVFFTAFDVGMVAVVANADYTTAAKIIARCVDANILRSVGLNGFTFAHEVTRLALAQTIGADRRAHLHRRAAQVFEARDEPPGLIAAHWRRAAGADAPEKTFHYARIAGDDSLARHDPAGASSWFSIALDATNDPATRCEVLVRLADAQRLAGDAAAAGSLRVAIQTARELGDTALLIKCATGWAPTWSSGLPFERDERVQLLEDAAAAAVEESDRALLLGRLATEMLYSDEAERTRPLAEAALAHAEKSGERRTRIEVHLRHFDATWSPQLLDARRGQIHDVLELCGERDVVDRCFALSRSAAAAIEAADLRHADAALAQLFELGEQHDLSVVAHAVTAVRAWRTALAGDLDEAERLVKHADELGNAAKLHNVSYGTAVQLFCLSWARGRFSDLLPILELGDPRDRARVPNRIMLSRALAAADRRDEARRVIETVTEEELECLPQDPLWSMVLMAAAEAAYMVGSVRVARIVHRLLLPFSSRVAFARNWVVEPIAFGAGVASAGAQYGDTDELFQEAIDISIRLDAPVLRARAQIAWVWTALRGSPTGAERERVRARVEEARTVFAERNLDALDRTAGELAAQATP